MQDRVRQIVIMQDSMRLGATARLWRSSVMLSCVPATAASAKRRSVPGSPLSVVVSIASRCGATGLAQRHNAADTKQLLGPCSALRLLMRTRETCAGLAARCHGQLCKTRRHWQLQREHSGLRLCRPRYNHCIVVGPWARRAHVRAQVGELGHQPQPVKVNDGAAAHSHHAGALRRLARMSCGGQGSWALGSSCQS